MAVDGLDGARDEETAHHSERAEEKGWASSPFVDVYDGWKGEDNVNAGRS